MYAEVKWFSQAQGRGVLEILEAGKMQGVEAWFKTADLAPNFVPTKGTPVNVACVYVVDGLLRAVDSTHGKIRKVAKQAAHRLPHRWIVTVNIQHAGKYRTAHNPTWHADMFPAQPGWYVQTFGNTTEINATITPADWRGDEFEPERED